MKSRLSNGTVIEVGNLTVGSSRIFAVGNVFTDRLFVRGQNDDAHVVLMEDSMTTVITDDILELTDSISVANRINTSDWTASLKEFIKAEGNLGVAIDNTEKQLQHIKTLHMMSNFSISHFTLYKFEGMVGAMSWLTIVIMILVVALMVLFCCGSCACCRSLGSGILKSTWFGVKGTFTLSWKLIRYMYRSKRERKHGASGHARRSAAAEGEELSEVLPDPAEPDPPVVVAYETVSTAWIVPRYPI